MKKSRKILCILLMLTLIIQSTSFAYAVGNNKQEIKTSNVKVSSKQEVNDEIRKSDEAKIHNQVEKIRKNEGATSLSKKEKKIIEEVEDRYDTIVEKENKILNDHVLLQEESASIKKSVINLDDIFTDGNGSTQDPYVITTPGQMTYISQDLSACYSLDNDIDMSGISWMPIGSFSGQFDGNDYDISNLIISSSPSYTGLFSSTTGASIQNLTLRNADISGNSVVAGFVGSTTNSILRNLTISSSNISGSSIIGGIVGNADSGTEIYNCRNNSTINATGTFSGGIVGFMNGTTVDDCDSTGNINGVDYTGGIAGVLNSNANRCTNTGTVSGNMSVGGIAGILQCPNKSVYLYYCYNLGNILGATEIAGIAGYVLSAGNGIGNIRFCANSGDIAATGYYAGGITGDSACHLYISKCYNTGDIDAVYTYGGLVGRLNNTTAYNSSLLESYNAGGDLFPLGTRAGSLIGSNYGILVNILYYAQGYGPGVAHRGSTSYIQITTPTTKSSLRKIHTTLGNPFKYDNDFINKGFPYINGINYSYNPSNIDCPTIVIPGIAGTEMYEGSNKLWVDIRDNVVERMELTTTGASVNDVNVSTNDEYGANNTYEDLITSLKQEYGNEGVYFFRYDWRMDNEEIADKLDTFIENEVCASRVNIVAHSMGGLVASRYIVDNSENINKLITIGTPYLGSPKVPYVFSTGKLIKFQGVYPVADGGIKRISSHMTSAYQLLPYKAPYDYILEEDEYGNREECDDEFDFIENKLKMVGVGLLNTDVDEEVKRYFLNKSTPLMESIHNSSNNIDEGEGSIVSSVIENVDTYVIAGTGEHTIKRTVYDSSGDFITDLTFTEGDGTVPEWSANINGLVSIKRYNADHTDLVSNSDVIEKVINMLNGGTPEYSYTSPENQEYMVIRVAAKADISISQDEETLTNIDGDENSDSNFGSMYEVGKNKDILIFVIDANEAYKFNMNSFSSKKINLDIRHFSSNDKLIREQSFKNLSVTENTNIISDIMKKNTVLSIDINGNGTCDKKVKSN